MQRLLAVLFFAQIFAMRLNAEPRKIYAPYENIFGQKKHVDGTPLLIQEKWEYYLSPEVRRTKNPDRYESCSTRIFAGAATLAADIIRSLAASRSR